MRSFSNIITNFATNLHLLVDSIDSCFLTYGQTFFLKSFGLFKNCCTFAPARTRQASPLDLWSLAIARTMLKCAGRFIFTQ